MKRKKPVVDPARNFVKKYMDILTKPAEHRSVKDYDRAKDKLNLKKELERGN